MHPAVLRHTWLLLLCLLVCTGGIIRHDVSEQDYLALGAEKQFEAVGHVFIDSVGTGSGVLISDRYVLSAAHVFVESVVRADAVSFTDKPAVTTNLHYPRAVAPSGVKILFNGRSHSVKRILIHPVYLDPQSVGACDLAILELTEPVSDIIPPRLNKMHDELSANVIGVGFGVSGTADKPESVAPRHQKIGGQNVIDSIGGYAYIGNHTVLMCDFDHPTRSDCNKMGSASPRPLEYICGGGDSGGGLFRQTDEQWELVGICSGVNTNIETLLKTGYYGQTMSWTRVSVFDNWISANTRR